MEMKKKLWMLVSRNGEFTVIQNDNPMFQFCSVDAEQRLDTGQFIM